jgi:RNA polymerase sigma-70 factor (ECF subfamily)
MIRAFRADSAWLEREGDAAPAANLAMLVARAQAGEQTAFDAIYARFADPLFHYLYARCGDVGLAEELTGDLWVRVVEKLPTFRFAHQATEASFAAWLYQIARHLLIDTYRKRGAGQVPLLENVPIRDAPLEERAIKAEEQQELRTAVEKLTPEQREVVLLRFVEGRSHAEVAQLTGRSEGAVKVMQHRALGALARLLKSKPRTKS